MIQHSTLNERRPPIKKFRPPRRAGKLLPMILEAISSVLQEVPVTQFVSKMVHQALARTTTWEVRMRQ